MNSVAIFKSQYWQNSSTVYSNMSVGILPHLLTVLKKYRILTKYPIISCIM